ncbi:hypothetical protein MKW98_016863 [Papaver atlanticum]|uniref:Uncharacterized protein n=1 Tax=Papaver atlanticum TaxID=357466 RepID=A0AAD4THA9_9MAGN|nr:hypothetical protein MKW98_016863 [Papaver atlanticum]
MQTGKNSTTTVRETAPNVAASAKMTLDNQMQKANGNTKRERDINEKAIQQRNTSINATGGVLGGHAFVGHGTGATQNGRLIRNCSTNSRTDGTTAEKLGVAGINNSSLK